MNLGARMIFTAKCIRLMKWRNGECVPCKWNDFLFRMINKYGASIEECNRVIFPED